MALGACGDGDGEPAAPGARPGLPLPLAPGLGAYTGSLHAELTDPQRPVFRWLPVELDDRRVTYDVELDDDCVPARMQRCRFATPEARATEIDDTRWTPPEPLPVNATSPLGRRYYWRLRACAGAACSPWTRVRYLEVGRVAGDINGDGFSDVVITAPLIDNGGKDRGSAFVYYGGRDGVGGRGSTRLDDPEGIDGSAFGVAAALVGDLDADGFADVIVGAAGISDHRGVAYVFHGSARGVSRRPRARLRDPAGQLDDWFGASIAGVGDVDADGFADALIAASGADLDGLDWGVTYLFRGSPGGVGEREPWPIRSLQPRDYDHFGYAVAPAGDVNADGYPDLLIGSPGIDLAGEYSGVDRGAVYLFHGGPGAPSIIPAARIEAPVPLDHDRFGFAVSGAGDVNGDGFDDIVIGAPGANAPVEDSGAVYVFLGSAFGLDPVPQEVLEDPRIEHYDRFGTSAASAGDVNGDGFGDVVIGTSGSDRGRGIVFHGAPEGLRPIPAAVLHDPLGPGYNHFADAVAGAGDVNGDGFDDVIIGASGSDNGGVFRGSAVLYPGGFDGIDASQPLRLDNPDTGEHDHFGHVVSGR